MPATSRYDCKTDNYPMNTVENLDNRIIVCNQIMLPRGMGKIDVLSPILKLEGREEDFVLDLHYSLSQERVWDTKEAHIVSNAILNKLLINEEYIKKQIRRRFEPHGYNHVDIFPQWLEGLKILSSWPCESLQISWRRCMTSN